MMKVLLCLVLLALCFSVSESVREQYDSSMCYAAMWNTGLSAQVQKIYPLKFEKDDGFYTSSQYYNYNNGDHSSANTFNDIELSQTAQYFFFDDDNEVSLFFFFDIPNDGDGGEVTAAITSQGLAGKGADITVRDDPGDSAYAWDDATGTSNPVWIWYTCCTDGMVLGGLPQPVPASVTNFNPTDYTYCINFVFSNKVNVDSFLVRSFDNYYEAGGRTLVPFPIPADQANTLQLCYTQCNCRQGATFTENYGSFDNKAVIEGAGSASGIGKYSPGSHCSWIIQPDLNPEYVAIYFDEFSFGNIQDIVSFSSDVDGNDVLYVYPTDDDTAADQLIWTPEILAGSIDAELDTSDYNTFLIPRSSSGTFEALVDFTSIIGSDGGPGFTIQYVSVARTDSVSPLNINQDGLVDMVVTGAFFINAPDLICEIQQTGETTRYVAATYVDSTHVICKIPAKLGGDLASNTGYVSISNDAFVYFNNATFNYYSADCEELSTCAVCSASPTCAWCEAIEGSQATSMCTTIPEPLSPEIPSAECPAEDYSWHHDCCNICTELNNCTDTNGECQCDSTCSCNEDLANNIVFSGEECDCICPSNSTGSICSDNGECDCPSSSCVCEYPYRGDLCECLECVGTGGEEGYCFGNGECGCDGKCTCDVGFHESDNCLCPTNCEGYDEVNDVECNGNGECSCGICICDIQHDGKLCDCAIPSACPSSIPGQECSGNGVCQCDATCECAIGFGGEDCSTPDSCDNVLCTDCQIPRTTFDSVTSFSLDQSFCKFCPTLSRCVSIYDPSPCSELGDSTSEEDDTLLLGPDECPIEIDLISEEIRVPNDDVSTAALIAALAGIVIAVIVAILLAVLGKSQGAEGLANFDFQNGDTGAMVVNPTHLAASTGGQSSLYQSKN